MSPILGFRFKHGDSPLEGRWQTCATSRQIEDLSRSTGRGRTSVCRLGQTRAEFGW